MIGSMIMVIDKIYDDDSGDGKTFDDADEPKIMRAFQYSRHPPPTLLDMKASDQRNHNSNIIQSSSFDQWTRRTNPMTNLDAIRLKRPIVNDNF